MFTFRHMYIYGFEYYTTNYMPKEYMDLMWSSNGLYISRILLYM